MPVNQRLAKIRNYYNFNQIEFSNEIGIAQSKISKIESGEQKMSLEIVSAIRKKFPIDTDWLIGEIGNDSEIIFKGDVVPRKELEKVILEKSQVMEELLIYKSKHIAELQEVNG